MQVYRHFHDLAPQAKGAVVALGNFDGVHRGHQALLGEARRVAREQEAPFGVLVFEPHPQEFFRPQAEPFRLTPFRARVRLMQGLGADILYALPFDAGMAARSAQDFVMDILVKGLGVRHIVIGADFLFGKGRAGDAAVLAYMGEMEGFGVTVFEPVAAGSGEAKISSSDIRRALEDGRPDMAAALLGHWWSVEARVEHGDARGRTLGFPTANLKFEGALRPAYGVYAVRVRIEESGGHHDGVANFGVRPMFESKEPLLEAHLFDFSDDLYGKHLAVEFVAYLRGEAKFADLDALKAQMAKDAASARVALEANRLPPNL